MKNIFKMDTQLLLIIISVLATGAIAIKAHYSEKSKEDDLKDKTEEIVSLQKKLIKSGQKTINKQDSLIEANKKKNVIFWLGELLFYGIFFITPAGFERV